MVRSITLFAALFAMLAICGTSAICGMLPSNGIYLVVLNESGRDPHNPNNQISVQNNKSEYETATESERPAKKNIKHFWFQAQRNTTKIFIYFYKPKDTWNSGDYACFANTFEKPDANKDPKTTGFSSQDFSITVAGKKYRSSEHYFQAHKFNNPDDAREAMENMEANQLPAYALQNKNNFGGQRADWHKGGSIQTMLKAVRAKFGQHRKLRLLLLSTYPNILVEDSAKKFKGPKDVIWGAGDSYSGGNLLGQILMLVRKELSDGKCYKFVEGDSLTYYKLLSGQADWEEDQNPDINGIPNYQDVLNEINNNKLISFKYNNAYKCTRQQIYSMTSNIYFSGLSALSGLFFGSLQSYFTPRWSTLFGAVLGTGYTAMRCSKSTFRNQKPKKLAVYCSALAGFIVGKYVVKKMGQYIFTTRELVS